MLNVWESRMTYRNDMLEDIVSHSEWGNLFNIFLTFYWLKVIFRYGGKDARVWNPVCALEFLFCKMSLHMNYVHINSLLLEKIGLHSTQRYMAYILPFCLFSPGDKPPKDGFFCKMTWNCSEWWCTETKCTILPLLHMGSMPNLLLCYHYEIWCCSKPKFVSN